MNERGIKKEITVKQLIGVIALTALLTCIFNIYVFFLPASAYCTQSLVAVGRVDFMGLPFIVILFSGLLKKLSVFRKTLSTETMALLFVITYAAATFSTHYNPWVCGIGTFGFNSIYTSESLMRYVPEFVSLPRNVSELLLRGNISVMNLPWNVLLPFIAWYIILFTLWIGISIGFCSIFRRQWIDIERLPFPVILTAYNAIVGLENVGKREWVGRLPFILGFIMGFLLEIPVSGATLFPWFPDIYSWRTNNCGIGYHHISFPGQPWNIGLDKDPLSYALFLLVPLNALYGIVFYMLVFEIALYITYAIGYYTGYAEKGFCGKYWCPPTPYANPPLNFSTLLTGAGIGFMVITLYYNRQYIIDVLKRAFGKVEVPSLREEEEPMPYRIAWTIFLSCFILMIVFFICTGVSPWVSFVLTLTAFVTWYVSTQMWARVIYLSTPAFWLTPALIKLLAYPTVRYLEIQSTDLAVAEALSWTYFGQRNITGFGNVFYISIGGYAIAQRTGIHPRKIIKVLIPALLTATVVAPVTAIILLGIYGGARVQGSLIRPHSYEFFTGRFWSDPSQGSMIELAPWLALGFIFMVVMMYLNTRILWLPHPIGALVVWWWLPPVTYALVAAIIKYLVLRIGGSKLYEERVVPFVTGFTLGYLVEILIFVIGFYATYVWIV
jgi:hypothetical protein